MIDSARLPLLAAVADRFKSLGEPARLRILQVLRDGERTVSEIIELTGLGQANVSRHLRVLHEHGFVERRREKLFVYYSLRGEDVFRLCDMMCARVEEDVTRTAESLRTA
ncbi:MAG TPA: metalloregulator ArsR/SmtB family transcription factor [Longimicrobiales bacterium]|nr:metalloregulator ArsR/SmtB family transcription factor [Longimicrobiales bacterium]